MSNSYYRLAMNGRWFWVKDLTRNSASKTWNAKVVNRFGEELDKTLIGDDSDLEECHGAMMNLKYGWLERKFDEKKSNCNSSIRRTRARC